MNTYIGLLRGINVGGNNKLPMKELKAVLEGMGLTKVKTYIQSGNVVFQSERTDVKALSDEMTAAIEKSHGFAPRLFVMDSQQLNSAIDANPYPEAIDEPKSLHFYFLNAAAESPDLESLRDLQKENERFELTDSVFYLHAPDGIGRSKLAEKVERLLGVAVTARNWRTVSKVKEMGAEVEAD